MTINNGDRPVSSCRLIKLSFDPTGPTGIRCQVMCASKQCLTPWYHKFPTGYHFINTTTAVLSQKDLSTTKPQLSLTTHHPRPSSHPVVQSTTKEQIRRTIILHRSSSSSVLHNLWRGKSKSSSKHPTCLRSKRRRVPMRGPAMTFKVTGSTNSVLSKLLPGKPEHSPAGIMELKDG